MCSQLFIYFHTSGIAKNIVLVIFIDVSSILIRKYGVIIGSALDCM